MKADYSPFKGAPVMYKVRIVAKFGGYYTTESEI